MTMLIGDWVKASVGTKERENCESSLLEFLQRGWKHIDPARFISNWHLEAIAEHLQAVTDGQIQRLVINVPPRTSKSSCVSVAWPAWTWIQPTKGPLSGPQVQFLSASYAYTLSLRDSVKTRRLIQSPWYQEHWGNRFQLTGDQNAKHRFENNKGGYRLATSVDGTTTGEGGDCFPAGTLVSTPSGTIAIEKIISGQEVLAFDKQRAMVVKGNVVATKSRILKGLYEFRSVKGHRFACTANHPIYSPGRGYIRACDLGVGDWLLREEAWHPRLDNAVQSSLCKLWQENTETVVRGQEGSRARQPRFLLFGGMSGYSFFDKTFQGLCDLWQAAKESSFALLFGRMCSGRQEWQKEDEDLSALRDGILRGIRENLLQSSLLQRGSFGADARESQFQVQGVGQVFQSVQGNWRVDTRARQPQVRSLWSSRQISQNRQGALAQEVLSSGASYRRRYQEQCAGKSDSSVSFVSQETPSWDFDRIASIVIHSNDEHRVYDVQVERWHNFFAEGILVHNCIIVDDPHKAGRESESEVVREATLNWWDEVMSTRLNDQRTGAFVVVMQRLHMEDLTGHVLTRQAGSWTHLMLPMEYDPMRHCTTYVGGEKFFEDPRTEEGELLCEARFNAKIVENLKRDLGPYAAAGQLAQSPTPRGGGLILDSWWKHWTEPKYPQCEFVCASLDTAYTEKSENDFSALSIWGVFRHNPENVIPLEIARQGSDAVEKWYMNQYSKVILLYQWQERLNFPDLVRKVMETCTLTPSPTVKSRHRFKIDRLLIENKAAGISVAQELGRQLMFSNQFGVELVDPRKFGDKVARLIAVQHLFENGIVHVPWPMDESGTSESPNGYGWVESAMDQTGVFPKGAHDDFVDSMTQALRWMRDSGILQRPEEHARDVHDELAYTRTLAPLYPI